MNVKLIMHIDRLKIQHFPIATQRNLWYTVIVGLNRGIYVRILMLFDTYRRSEVV